MTTTATLERTPWTGIPADGELAHWSAIAETAAATLAQDALQRDRANLDPHAELDVLREAGLVTLLHPAEFGGGGAQWSTALTVIRILSRADASVAQVLAYHYVNAGNIGFSAQPEDRERWYRQAVEGREVWGDAVNPVDPNLTLSRDGEGYRLSGLKRFATGASVGDIVLVNAVPDDGGPFVYIALPHDTAGIHYLGDWDALGQRLSASGAVRFDDVRVEPEHVLSVSTDEPFESLVTPGIQLLFGNLYLGIAEGAFARGLELVRARPNAWFLSEADRYRNDPFIQRTVGEFAAQIAATEALADRVNANFDRVIGRGSAVTAEDRGLIEIDIARLKIVSDDVAITVTNRIFEVTGSSSAANRVGLDLWWRNIRTHSLHDPVDFKKLEVGAYHLNGEFQPVSLYT